MAHDSSSNNPFQALAQTLAGVKRKKHAPRAGTARAAGDETGRPHGRPDSFRRENPVGGGLDEDLFLKALGALEGEGESGAEDERLFALAMRGVRPITAKGREVHAAAGGKNLKARPADPARALRDLLDGRLEFALSHSDEYLEGHVVGIDPMVLIRLRAGQFSPESHLDLHGQNSVQAQNSLTWFIRNAYQRGLRNVLVITGRGKNSPDGVGVLRPLLPRWLSRDPFKRVVLAFCTARAGDGGAGAIYVLLRKYKKNRGRIIWERGLYDDDLPDI